MKANARVGWAPCGAYARSSGNPCRAEGSGIGGRCPLHGGLTLCAVPDRTWTLLIASNGVAVKPSRPAHGRHPKERARLAARWPQRIRPWIAIRLIASGHITRAVIWRGEGKRLLESVRERGVQVSHKSRYSVASEVHFKAPPREPREPKASKATARKGAAQQ